MSEQLPAVEVLEKVKHVIASQAVQVRDEPFTLKSGRKSKVYINMRVPTMQHPTLFGQVLYEWLQANNYSYWKYGHVGIAKGGIPLVCGLAAVTPTTLTPVAWAESAAKEHGIESKLSRPINRGIPLILYEDVVTTGGSVIKVADALVADGYEIAHIIAMVDRQEGGAEAITEAGHSFSSGFGKSLFTDQD
jgi:orotate phosphoribosyltransferase